MLQDDGAVYGRKELECHLALVPVDVHPAVVVFGGRPLEWPVDDRFYIGTLRVGPQNPLG